MSKGFAKTIKMLIIGVIMIGLIALAYYRVSNTKNDRGMAEKEVQTTVVQQLLLRNLEKDYPPTPKEVVKFYSDITQCYYNEDFTDDELKELAELSLQLFDEDLRARNSLDTYLTNLKMDIVDHRANDSKIFSYYTSASTDVEYYQKDGRDMASLRCTYTIRVGTAMGDTTELFILRKDDSGHWKILGWLVEEE